MKLVALGTYDTGKPRMRILLRGLSENGVKVTTCHEAIWKGVEDKSQLTGLKIKLAIIGKFLLAYPRLIWRYLHLPSHDVVLIGYLGLFDLLILWPFIKIRGVPIVWDVFISLYNTVVEDRQIISRRNPLAWSLYIMEWIGLRVADQSIIDTEAHAQYIRDTYHCSQERIQPVFVGAEPEVFDPSLIPLQGKGNNKSNSFQVMFYGQFIPLHGIETVVQAAKLTETDNIEWLLIGRGQEANKIRQLIDTIKPAKLNWIEWVEYEKLITYLMDTDVALGIFGDTDKASRVIPNKVFQILSSGKPLITRDSPAIRELLEPDDPYCLLVFPADPESLVSAVLKLRTTLNKNINSVNTFHSYRKKISPDACGQQLVVLLNKMLLDRSV